MRNCSTPVVTQKLIFEHHNLHEGVESELNIDQFWPWFMTNWFAVFSVLAPVIGLILSYLAIRKPRWHKYRYRALPYARIFRGKEYGYDPSTFIRNIKSAELALRCLQEWYEDDKPLLLIGPAGIGKSRLVTEFLGNLPFLDRSTHRVLMPTPDEMANKLPPLNSSRSSILHISISCSSAPTMTF